MVILVLL